ncbi:MAG: hypothetical protein DIU71_07015 [Proteobacteria bacterium]|nr:MAG: hypothetical protein DIU71_07015 [Pseudomonadota bacterium]
MTSAWEHFFAATLVLASAGPIKYRLVEAYRKHLEEVDQEQLPKEIREEFSSLRDRMHCVPPMRGETAVHATVRKMSEMEAGRMAHRIVNMLGVIARTQGVQRPMLRAVNAAES